MEVECEQGCHCRCTQKFVLCVGQYMCSMCVLEHFIQTYMQASVYVPLYLLIGSSLQTICHKVKKKKEQCCCLFQTFHNFCFTLKANSNIINSEKMAMKSLYILCCRLLFEQPLFNKKKLNSDQIDKLTASLIRTTTEVDYCHFEASPVKK